MSEMKKKMPLEIKKCFEKCNDILKRQQLSENETKNSKDNKILKRQQNSEKVENSKSNKYRFHEIF